METTNRKEATSCGFCRYLEERIAVNIERRYTAVLEFQVPYLIEHKKIDHRLDV